MASTLRDGIQDRISVLERKLSARSNQPEYKRNCAAIRQEITRLQSLGTSYDL